MQFSLMFFGYPPDHYLPAAMAAETAGFDAIWLAEHLATPADYAKVYPYNDSGDPGYRLDTPLVDVWVTIAHLAAVTERILFGTGVYVLPLRNPFVTAKAVATAQALSKGRVMLGVGTGWMREEFEAVGEPWKDRGLRTDEAIEVMRGLWRGRPFSYQGDVYRFPEVQMSPPVPPPPVIVGGVSKPALERAARLGDGWYGPSCTLEESAAYRDAIVLRLSNHGRDAQPFAFWARLNRPDEEQIDLARRLGLDRLVIPIPYTLQTLEEKLARIDEVARNIGLVKERRRG
jgi:probable F420-dependent oxidoreductase